MSVSPLTAGLPAIRVRSPAALPVVTGGRATMASCAWPASRPFVTSLPEDRRAVEILLAATAGEGREFVQNQRSAGYLERVGFNLSRVDVDLVGGGQHGAHVGMVVHDARVTAQVGHCRCRRGQRVDRGAPAGVLELAGAL